MGKYYTFTEISNAKDIEIEYLDKKFDFKISPDKFLEWLESVGQEVTGDYGWDVASMCEYSCLYICQLLYNKKLKGELTVCLGNFGFGEHYWMQYEIDGEKYYIDLTLQQFRGEAPRLAITKAFEHPKAYRMWGDDGKGEYYKKYVERMGGPSYDPNEVYDISDVINQEKIDSLMKACDDIDV